MPVAFGQHSSLFERVDLRVALDQDRRRSGLPAEERLCPQRRVVRLAGLGPEDGELSAGRVPSVNVDVSVRSPRRTVSVIVSPGSWPRSRRSSG